MGSISTSRQCFMGIDASRALRSTSHKQVTMNKITIKEYQCRRQNAPEWKIEDKFMRITAKIDYQKPNPPN